MFSHWLTCGNVVGKHQSMSMFIFTYLLFLVFCFYFFSWCKFAKLIGLFSLVIINLYPTIQSVILENFIPMGSIMWNELQYIFKLHDIKGVFFMLFKLWLICQCDFEWPYIYIFIDCGKNSCQGQICCVSGSFNMHYFTSFQHWGGTWTNIIDGQTGGQSGWTALKNYL